MSPLLPALFALAGVAQAHPFDASFHGHQLELGLVGETLTVAYLVEVPTVDALTDLERFLEGVERPGPEHQAAYTARVLDELEGGLEVRVDGARVRLDRVAAPEPSGVGDRRFITFRVHLEGALPAHTRTVHVINANFPGERALFSNQAWVDDGIDVHATDLVELRDGRVVKDEGGRWLAGEEQRELRLSITRVGAGPRWVRAKRRRWVDPEAPALIPAREALVGDAPGLVRRTVQAGGGPGGPVAAAGLSGLVEVGPVAVLLGLGAGMLGLGGRALASGLLLGAVVLGVGGLMGLPALALASGCGAAAAAAALCVGPRPRLAGALTGLALAALPGATALRCVAEGELLDPGLGASLAAAAWAAGAALASAGWGGGRLGAQTARAVGAARALLVGGAVLALVSAAAVWRT